MIEMKKTKSCKLMCMLLVLAMLLGLFAGCAAGGGEATNPPATTEPTQSGGPDVTEPSGGEDTTEPTGTEPADPGVTEPTVTDPSDATEPTDVTGPADVTEPSDPSDPADPTEPTPPVETEPGHEHEYDKTVTAATCTEDGFATYTCKGCGDSYVGELTPAVGHKYGEWATTEEPTEAAEGAAERTCSTCGAKETKVLDKLIPNHTHSYTGKVTTAATCTKEGVTTYTCSCGGSYTESISKLGHSYKNTVTAPTCTAQGYTTHKCSTCGDSYKDTYVAMVSHKYGSYTSNGDATCTKDGTKTAKCSVCGGKDTQIDTGSAKGHSYKSTVTAPTCTEKGYTTNKCGVCGDSYKDSYVNANGHKFSNYTSNGDATCSKDGTKTATCANGCGKKDTKTDAGSMTDHKYDLVEVWESFITGPGWEHYECRFCNASYDNYLPEWTEAQRDQFLRDVEDAIFKYINQFREEEGEVPATLLPGMRQVAQYRAVQLQKDFSHNEDDIREAHAYYKYGKYFDATQWGDDPSYSYYTSEGTEAIATRGAGDTTDADKLGYLFACQFRNSPGHWGYLKLSKFQYMSVGAEHGFGYQFTVCVMVSRQNHG